MEKEIKQRAMDGDSVDEKYMLEKQQYELIIKARDKEIEALKQETETLRREL
jgi:hypothetical protein